MRSIVAIYKFFMFFLLCLIIVPSQLLVMAFSTGPASYIIPKLFHKGVCTIFGTRFKIVGTPNTNQQTIYMSNHLSYLDISMIGSLLTGSFVAKAEVEHWPVFGFLSKLQRTAFIQRKASEITKQKNSLQARLKQGQSLIIFPEGTSTDGRSVYPFKSSLFSIALEGENENLYVQPVTISMLENDGKPVETQDDRDLYAWHRDMDTDLATHLWRYAKSAGALLELKFHPPLRAKDFTDRKELANTCQTAVSSGLINRNDVGSEDINKKTNQASAA